MNLQAHLLRRLRLFFSVPAPDPAQQTARIRLMERNGGLPVKAAFIAMLFYYLFYSNWFSDVTDTPLETGLDVIRAFFLIYVVINAGAASMLLGMRNLPLTWVQWAVFNMGWVDALFLAGLTVVTGGFDSILFWVFLGLIVRNAVSNPIASRQIVLNSIVAFCYFLAGVVGELAVKWQEKYTDEAVLLASQQAPQEGAEPLLLRVFLLVLITLCCYGVQVLFDRQRLAEAEAREYMLRQQQLQATGRLAAEIAHQLKNPLGIINNAAFTLQRTVKEGKTITQQIQIIREEVDRSDRIITELMGYARLSEGKVEKLNVSEELDRAIDQVFPAGAKYEVKVKREYAPALPALLMQRSHLSEVFVNILQNAREAMNGNGEIHVTAQFGDNYSVVITIADNGPGIAADSLPKVFEPYFTTKERGTGLGLAIVKHNTEIYGGNVEVHSEVGKGTHFTISLPAKTVMKLRR